MTNGHSVQQKKFLDVKLAILWNAVSRVRRGPFLTGEVGKKQSRECGVR